MKIKGCLQNIYGDVQSKFFVIKKPIKSLKNQSGFTLIEIMIVITIIGMIVGLVAVNVTKKLDEARVTMTKTQMKSLGTTLDDFRRVCGFYPSTEQGLSALVSAPTTGRQCKSYDPDGYIKQVPKDGWNSDFIYTSDGNKYEIRSYGPSGADGGKGALSSNDPD